MSAARGVVAKLTHENNRKHQNKAVYLPSTNSNMENDFITMYPGCDKDPNACFDRYIRERIVSMSAFHLTTLHVGEFSSSYDAVLKKIAADENRKFFYQTNSRNIGTVKDRFNYSFTLYLKTDNIAAYKSYREKLDSFEKTRDHYKPSLDCVLE